MPQRRHLLSIGVLAVCLAGAAGAAPAGICPCPLPKPGQIRSTPFPHPLAVATEAVAEAEDGSMVVAGAFETSWIDDETYRERALALGRFRPDGLVDTTFGVGGAVRDERFGGRVGGVALDASGRIVVAGWDDRVPVVARYAPTGRPDRTFGKDGITRGRPEPPGNSLPTTLAARVLADGTIVVVSFVLQAMLASEPVPGGLSFLRLDADGRQLSRTLRSTPEWVIGEDHAYGTWAEASIQPDGTVVTAGSVADPAPFKRACPCEVHSQLVVRRFSANGSVDPTFGNRGRTTTTIGSDASAADVAATPGGAIVVGGIAGSGDASYAAVRYHPDGTLDRSFAAGGVFTLPAGSNHNGTERVAISPDGGVLLAGRPGVTVVRLDRAGKLVPTFGGDGVSTFQDRSIVADVLASSDDGARVATTGTGASLRIVRFDAGGHGATGPESEIPIALSSRGANAVVALERGGALLGGWIDTGTGVAAHLARTGRWPGSRFGSRSRVTLDLGPRTEATALSEWPDGSVLAAGVVAGGETERWFAAKLTGQGSRDGRFGADGVVDPIAPARRASVDSAVALVGGRAELLGRRDDSSLLVRLLASGARDSGFGDRGIVELPLDDAEGLVVDGEGRSFVGGAHGGKLAAVVADPAGHARAPMVAPIAARAPSGVAVQPDGAVLAAGTTAEGLAVARWRADGTLDTRFGVDGVVTRVGYDAEGIVVQRDGRIVVAARDRATGGTCLLRLLFGGGIDAAFGTDGVARAPLDMSPSALARGPQGLYLAGSTRVTGGTDLALTAFYEVPLAESTARGVAVARLSPRGAARSVAEVGTHPSVSPDGRSIAYVGDDDGASGLFVADANGARRRQITGSPFEDGSVVRGYAAPVWSRDGRLLAFETLDAAGTDQISIVQPGGQGLRTVATGTGPTWGPGRLLAYTAPGGEVRILDVDSGESRFLVRGGGAQWSPRGDLIAVGSTLLRPDGTVVADVGLAWPSWKPDGTALVGMDGRRIVAIDVARKRSRTVSTTGIDRRSPTWSRDGRWIAYIRYVGVYQLVIVDARTGRRVVAWRTPGSTFAGTVPVWGRDGVYVGVF